MGDEIPDRSGGATLALDEIAAIEHVVAEVGPLVSAVLRPRFDRVRGYIVMLDSLLTSALRDEERRIDADAAEADAALAAEDEALRRRLDAFHAKAEVNGQESLLAPEAPPHDL